MSTPDSMPPVPTDSASNPYAAPQSEILGTNPLAGTLASPWIRLVAQFIDGLILLPVNLIVSWLLIKVDQDAMNAAMASGDMAAVMKAASPPFYLVMITNLIAVAALVAINWKFLPNGQTIGKKVMKLQILSRSGSLLPVNTLRTKRLLPLYIAAAIPVIGGFLVLIDALFIFRPGRNTLHDDLADSKVVVL